jgi:hypothetical protein
MSVQIQLRIMKFSPNVSTVLSLITKALDILHGNLFRIYEGSPKRSGPYLFLSIYIFTRKSQHLLIMKCTECTEWGLHGNW